MVDKKFSNFITNIHERTQHFFKYVDRQALIDSAYLCSSCEWKSFSRYKKERYIKTHPSYRLFHGSSYVYYVTKCHKICRAGDWVAGLYFPDHQGDRITIGRFPTFTITDTNQIYFPIENIHMFPLLNYINALQVLTTSHKPFYVIYILLRHQKQRRAMVRSCFSFKINDNYEYRFGNGNYGKYKRDGWIATVKCPSNDYYAYIIQCAWWKYKYRKIMKQVHNEIKAIPELGIDYFIARTEFYNLVTNLTRKGSPLIHSLSS